jgi:type VI secretion system secreted protein VgrG
MPLTQATREISIQTPLGENALLLRSFEGQESLSQLFRFELELASENPAIGYDDIVGKSATVSITLADGTERYWNGWISRFVQMQRDSKAASYRATLVPWLWFLEQTTDCRIFQDKTTPDLLKQIFRENGYTDFVMRLKGDFATRDYCVQYRESDLNFVSRLMEEEGIFYFFEHEKEKHTLVLGNDVSAIKASAGQPKARYSGIAGGWSAEDVVIEWIQERRVRPGVYTMTDYNFETPTMSLLSTAKGKTQWELYDYPGEYGKRADGDRLARTRLEEHQMTQLTARGRSDCRAFSVGEKFTLAEHFRDDVNQDYLLTAVHHTATHDINFSSGGDADSEPIYTNEFECMPATTPLRPPRLTPIPVVRGCHTAVVVGPTGEEIFTDKYGRVKVQFHWDREGKKNENSSCWVRVSYPTAGKMWGAIQIPRIGQEVIVDFLEGDPDRPIITGRTYNAGQMPPYDLPGQMMVSGFKSNSTKGGGGYNELAFDDTKGNELIRVHGQHDMDTVIEHDERRHVINDRSKKIDKNETTTIGVDRTENVGANEKITIGANRTESVGANEQIKIGANRTENVGSNESITVALARTRNVGVNEMINIGGAQEVTIGGLQALTVGGARAKTIGIGEAVNIGAMQTINIGAGQTVTVGASQSTSIGAAQTVTIGSDLAETIGGGHTESVAKDRSASIAGGDAISVGKSFTLTATDEIAITTGDASILMKKDGTITIQGKNITIKGSGKIVAEATGDMTLKGSKILQN